jgi:uncharacterized protein YbjT (DUF2867 family)
MPGKTLVTGATGYIGGLLASQLVAENVSIRVAGRRTALLEERFPGVDAAALDVLDPARLHEALAGIEVAYYLIHSMEQGATDFAERDRVAARNFGKAALAAGVRRVVFLGGLGDDSDTLSHHLSSRHETGVILAEHGPQLIELRAGIVIGAGSASFQMLRDLVHRLPAMVTPKWVDTRAQPIGVDDVVAYLSAARDVAAEDHHVIVEIGGADVLTYRELMKRFALAGGRRAPLIVPVPVLTPRLSSLWCGLVTAVPVAIARPLIDGLKNEVVVRDRAAATLFPNVHPMSFDEAVKRALAGR